MEKPAKNYLGVSHSAGGKIWRSRLDRQSENSALQMVQKYGFSDSLARVLVGRGVEVGNAERFLSPSLRSLMPEPYLLQDMEKAAERLAKACLNHETIAIFADYDVDGACSAALLVRFLMALGVKNRIYIPDREIEGYGPNVEALCLLEQEGASLIITVDCGANSSTVFTAARQAGLNADILVIDHHQTLMTKTTALKNGTDEQNFTSFIHVNPNRFDDISGLGYLAAAGVVFMCLVATARQLRQCNAQNIPDLLGFLDLVALATICDIVPLQALNRAFVSKGLAVAHKQCNIGLKALAQAARINEPLNPYHCGYILGPRINAGGRIGNAALGARLLTCTDISEADNIAAQLDSLNFGRQQIETEQFSQALESAKTDQQAISDNFILVYGAWHIGIVGLIAARLKEYFNKPALAMTIGKGGQVTGSARSVRGIDIGRLIGQAAAAGILEKGGGHTMAAGFSLQKENIPLFRAWLEQNLAEKSSTQAVSLLELDGSLSVSGVTVELIKDLEKAGPYGAGHDSPLFALPNHKIAHIQEMGQNGAHLRIILADGQGNRLQTVAFRTGDTELGRFLRTHSGKQAHFAGTLSLNHWRGQVTPQFHIIDAAEIE